jgi:hypothetical protein
MAKIAHEDHDHPNTPAARLLCRRQHGQVVVDQTEFISVTGDAPVVYFDSDPRQNWLLVVGVCNIIFLPEQKAEVIERLRGAIKILESDQ